MEQGPTFRISLPKYPAKDPHYRIVAHQRSRFTHHYFYVRDEVARTDGCAGGFLLPLRVRRFSPDASGAIDAVSFDALASAWR